MVDGKQRGRARSETGFTSNRALAPLLDQRLRMAAADVDTKGDVQNWAGWLELQREIAALGSRALNEPQSGRDAAHRRAAGVRSGPLVQQRWVSQAV